MGLNADLQFPQRPHEFLEIAEVVPAGGPGDFRPGNPGSAATIGPKHPAPRNPPVADFQRPDNLPLLFASLSLYSLFMRIQSLR